MHTTYVAYGMELRSSFALAGMTAKAAAELPSISLRRRATWELQADWSGCAGAAEWQGVLGDGRHLTIERGAAGDLLFSYEDRAHFRLHPGKDTLDCAPAEAGSHWQQVLLGRILPNVAMERGYEALHASAVDSPEGVLAVAAPSGMGKTTLASELMSRGLPLFADDVLTLATDGGGVYAEPAPPLMNLSADAADRAGAEQLGRTLAVLGEERWTAAVSATTTRRPVRMICLFERGPGLHLEINRLPPSPLPLAPYMLGLDEAPERERSRFTLYADLVDGAELVKLTCDAEHGPRDVADMLEQALLSPALPSTRSTS